MLRPALALAVLLPPVAAQGTRYLGPGDLVPLQERAPNEPPPGNAAGVRHGSELSRFEFFWELRQDAWLDARTSRLPIGEELVLERIVPALRGELDNAEGAERVAAAMMALARLDPSEQLVSVLHSRVRDRHPRVRAVALVALGIHGSRRALGILTAQVRLAGTEVERSGAVWGLGLLAARSSHRPARRAALATLRTLVTDDTAEIEARVAAIHGLAEGSLVDATDRDASLELLETLWNDEASPALVRAQVPPVVAVLAPDRKTREQAAARWLVTTRQLSTHPALRHAALCGIGLALAGTQDEPTSSTLGDQLGCDLDTLGMTAIALARIGGPSSRQALLELLTSGNKEFERPWAAIALGILEHGRIAHGEPPDDEVRRGLREALSSIKNPSTRSAIGLGIALAGDRDAIPDLATELGQVKNYDEFAGALGISLALLDPEAFEQDALTLYGRSVRRLERKVALASALGQIGTPACVDALLEQFGRSGGNVHALAAEARALGATRSPRAIEPLLAILADEERPDLVRAHASIALGLLADPRPEPWNAALLARVPWRAFPASALGYSAGILNWL